VAVFAATSLSGSVSDNTTIENEPRSSPTALRTAIGEPHLAAQIFLNQMRDELGVGFGFHLVSALDECRAQVEKIFHDTVMDHGDRPPPCADAEPATASGGRVAGGGGTRSAR